MLAPIFADMGAHITAPTNRAEAPLLEAKQIAARNGTTVKSLVEAGMRQMIAERKRPEQPFVPRAAGFKGCGLQPDVQGGHAPFGSAATGAVFRVMSPLEFMQRLAALVPRPLAGRVGPVARPLARHKQSTGLFVSGLGGCTLSAVVSA